MGTTLKDLFDVEISSATKGVTQVGFGTVLILGSTGFSNSDIVRTYDAEISQVGADFASSTPEYIAAESIIEQNPTISKIKIGKRSALVAQIENVQVLTATDAHVYVVQVNGNAYSYTAPSSSTVAGIAAGLATLIAAGEPTLSVDSTADTLSLQANRAGNGFSVVVEDVKLSAVVMTANHGVAEDIAAIQAVDDDWYMLALASRVADDILNAAAYIEAADLKMFGACSSDAGVLTTGSTDVAAKLFAKKFNRTFYLWSDSQATYPEAGWMATNQYTPGQETWAYKTAAGSVASKLSATQRQNARAKNANTYETYAGNDIFLFGIVASGEYIDVIRLRDWTVSQIQERLFAASVNSPKIPYDDAGASIYHSIILGVLQDGVNNGGYIDGTISVNVPRTSAQSQANRQARKMAGITFSAQLAGAIHTGAISGTVTV